MMNTLKPAAECNQGSASMFQCASDKTDLKKSTSKPIDLFSFPPEKGCDKSNPLLPPGLCAPGTKNGLTMLIDFMDFLAKDPKAAEAFLDLAGNLLDEFGDKADKPVCHKPPMFAVK